MPSNPNAILALKNAWTGAMAAADRLRELAAAVDALPDNADLAALDLESYRAIAAAQATATLALRGLIEDLQRQAAAG